jgi:hypothetical protein
VYTTFQLQTVFDLNQLQTTLDNASIASNLASLQIQTTGIEIFPAATENLVNQFLATLNQITFKALQESLTVSDSV